VGRGARGDAAAAAAAAAAATPMRSLKFYRSLFNEDTARVQRATH